MSIVLFLGIVLLPLAWLFFVGNTQQRIGITIVSAVGLAAGLAWWNAPPATPPAPLPSKPRAQLPAPAPTAVYDEQTMLPSANVEEGYVSSNVCKECHPGQHDSWHRTYHRTMTQPATPEAVVPSFDNVTLTSRGRTYRLMRRGDEFWVDTVDPAAELAAFLQGIELAEASTLPRAIRKIVMTTGSHWHQTYWMQNANGTLIQFPWVYHINTKRWVYRIDSFLRPPGDTVSFNIWNETCIACHATGSEPRVDDNTQTMHSVGELGISCEACHGPGAEHVAWARGSDARAGADRHIVNPRSVSPEVSAQICGQCHVSSERRDEQEFLAHGDPYRPGNDHFETLRQVVRYAEDIFVEDENFGDSIKSRFWPDGTVRTGGREYNGLIRSSCYLNGKGDRQMTCISCHSLHDYISPNKLMAKEMDTDHACTQCHGDSRYTDQLSLHTHHDAASSGSRCVNCHMPHTSYALFSAIRSHRIQSPAVRADVRGGRPNACNLCHLDETKSWTARHLHEWYQTDTAELNEGEQSVAAGLLWGLKGDAAQRAIVAWHLRWGPARDAAGTDWMPALAAELLTDSYPAVRYVAYESLKTHPEYENLDYDFDGTAKSRRAVRDRVVQLWRSSSGKERDPQRQARLLMSGTEAQRIERFEDLLEQQDKRPISILE